METATESTSASASASASEAGARGLRLHKMSTSLDNSIRLNKVAQRLAFHVQAGPKGDNKDFVFCCISLARGVDFSIANNDIPAKARELPSLIKQVCQCRSNDAMRAAIMVLMISVKSACRLRWFPLKESQELLALADEMANEFGSLGDISPSLTSPVSSFSQIMERFYPFLKLGHILLSVQAKPGFSMLVTDFHVSKKMPHSPHQKILLFVAQTDNIETSACIMNPPQVSFLLNGKGVDKRVNIAMDSGPQLPTNVTRMLKYGTNLLQAMGHFTGHYIIVLAFSDVIPLPDTSLLKDYVQPTIESNRDSDIIEGPSRISLNCPISHTRIKLPIKGYLCKHLQCFDYGNYIKINTRKPYWRCPHCNQPICYTDICVDQNMVQVLKEAGHNATEVIISADGSWKVVAENDENMDPIPVQKTKHDFEDPSSFLDQGPIVLDLTGDDHQMDTFGKTEIEDRKPIPSDLQRQSAASNSKTLYNNVNNTAASVGFSSGFHISNSMLHPAQTSDTAIGHGYTNLSQIPRTRNPIAIQAVPPQFSQNSSLRDRPTSAATVISESIPTAQSSQVQTPPVMSTGHSQGRNLYLERFHPYPRSSTSPPQVPATTSSQNFPATLSRQHPTRVDQLKSAPPSSTLPQSRTLPGVGQQTRFGDGGQLTAQTGIQQRLNNLGGGGGVAVQSVSRASNLDDLNTDTNWRPLGRMRGSLMPGSYSPDLDHLIIRPTQQSQPTRPPSSQPVQQVQPTASYLGASAQIESFLANHSHQTVQAGALPIVVPPGLTGPSPTLAPKHPGTQ